MKLVYLILGLLTFGSCHVGRFVTKNYANITDYKIFPYTKIESESNQSYFQVNLDEDIASLSFDTKKGDLNLRDYLNEYTKTTAFLVVHQGEIKFEEYFRSYQKEDIPNIFLSLKVSLLYWSGLQSMMV